MLVLSLSLKFGSMLGGQLVVVSDHMHLKVVEIELRSHRRWVLLGDESRQALQGSDATRIVSTADPTLNQANAYHIIEHYNVPDVVIRC